MEMMRPFLSLGDTTVADMPIHSVSYEKPKPFLISCIVTLLDALVEPLSLLLLRIFIPIHCVQMIS
jgi:hypothetical protein